MSESENSGDSPPLLSGKSGRLKYLWVVGVLAYVVFVAYVGWGDIRVAWSDIEYEFLLWLVVVDLLVLWFRVSKWHVALRGEGEITRLAFLSKAGGNLTPGRLGEFSPLLIQRFRSPRIGAWILADRLLEASATLILGLIGIVAVVGIVEGNILLYVSIVLLIGIVLGSYFLTQERVVESMKGVFSAVDPIIRFLDVVGSIGRELALLRPKVPVFMLMTLVATAMDILIGYFLYRAMGFEVTFALLAFVQVVHAVTSIVPITPNATGVPYAAAATILYQVGGVSLEALALSIALRMVLGNGVFWLSFLVGVRSRGDAVEVVD